MNHRTAIGPILAWVVLFNPVWAEAEDEISTLRAEVARIRADYEARITQLERRLEAAEREVAAQGSLVADTTTDRPDPSGSGNAFNPAIGVIFEGSAWRHDIDPDGYAIPGFPLGGETGPAGEGLVLGETEIDVSASVDDLFSAWLTTALAVEDGEVELEIEEAWLETLSLPAGLSARFGRMFSEVGYLNDRHAHSWDFADLPLPYAAFLGGQYIDDGIRLSWLAPTDLYFQLSGEVLRGDRYPFTGAGHSGFGAHTLRARLGGDVGAGHGWQAGLSWLSGDAADRESGDEEAPLIFDGDADIVIADFVWKWAPGGNWRQRNFKFALEYLWRDERGHYLLPDGRELPWDVSQEGWYAEAVYQFMPQWRVGGRVDALSGDDPGPAFDGTPLERGRDDPMRFSLMADWSHSEFSRLRLQYTRDEAGATDDDQLGLQYILSIGAHGAHSF